MANNLLNWYVVTGGPSSGKTTVIQELAKLGYFIYPEAARVYIDEEIAKGKTVEEIRGDEARFQREILRMKVEIEKRAPRNKIVFFDRAIPDSIAYYQISGLDPKEVLRFCQKKIYRKIFFFEQLAFEKDYARTEDDETIKKLNVLLRKNYKDLGHKVIDVPAMSVEERISKILTEIKNI